MKISIITINYNNDDGLKETIRSVVDQDYKHIEYIVIDGGSTDTSKDVIKSYENLVSYWVSEPDRGIYHAMNKGILASSGEYLLFLNSGDVLMSDTVITQAMEAGMTHDLVSANLLVKKKDGLEEWIPENELSFQTFYVSTIPHPSTFIKRDLFEQVGFYNEKYKIASDWEFFLLATCKYNCSYKHHNFFLTLFSDGGISSIEENFEAIALEREQILNEHFRYFIFDYSCLIEVKEELRKVGKYIKLKKFIKKLFQ